MVRMVTDKPQTTSWELQEHLAADGVVVQESLTKMKLRRDLIFQQDNDPKHWSNSCRGTSAMFWKGHASALTLTSLKMYGLISSRLSTHESQETWLNLRHFVRRNGPKYHLPDVRDVSVALGGDYRLLLQQKETLLNINGLISLGCPNLCTCLFMFKCT